MQVQPVVALNSPSPHILTLPALTLTKKELVERIQNLKFRFFGKDPAIEELEKLSAEEVHLVLQHYFKNMVENLDGEDPISKMERLLKALPLDLLSKSIGVNDLVAEAKERFKEAKYYLEKSQGVSITVKAYWHQALDALIAILQSLLDTFGFGSFFTTSQSELHAEFKSRKIMILISTFSMMTQALVPAIGAEAFSKILTGFMLCLTALSLVWDWIKPLPAALPGNGVCVNREVEMGGFVPEGREVELKTIANLLKMKTHVLIVAPSRTGKTILIKSLAQAIDRGDFPELKGTRLYRFNVAEMATETPSFIGGTSTLLQDISKGIGNNKSKVILVQDEIHMACKDGAKLGDKLKSCLDEEGIFERVIGITTTEEYVHIQNNKAFDERFEKLFLKSTLRNETIKILNDAAIRSPVKPIVEDGALDDFFDLSPADAPQPYTALKAFKKKLGTLGKGKPSANDLEIVRLKAQMGQKRSELVLAIGKDKNKLRGEIAKLKTQKKVAQEERENEASAEPLFAAKKQFDEVIKKGLQALLRFRVKKDPQQLKLYWVVEEYLKPALRSYVCAKGEALDIPIEIRKMSR